MHKAPRTSVLTAPKDGTRKAAALLQSPDAYTASLLVLCFDRFAADVAGHDSFLGDAGHQPWSLETVAYELRMEFGVTPLEANLHKIMAATNLLTSDEFFQNVRQFVDICNVLAGDDFDPSTFDPATCAEMAWGLTEATSIRELPDDYGDNPFSDEIRGYIGFMLDYEGIVNAPDVLRLGVRNKPGDPLNVWADDPELYEAAFAVQQEKSDDIQNMLKENLVALLQQLEELPLIHGSANDLAERVLTELRQR